MAMGRSRSWWSLTRVYFTILILVFGGIFLSAMLAVEYPAAWQSFWFDAHLAILHIINGSSLFFKTDIGSLVGMTILYGLLFFFIIGILVIVYEEGPGYLRNLRRRLRS